MQVMKPKRTMPNKQERRTIKSKIEKVNFFYFLHFERDIREISERVTRDNGVEMQKWFDANAKTLGKNFKMQQIDQLFECLDQWSTTIWTNVKFVLVIYDSDALKFYKT